MDQEQMKQEHEEALARLRTYAKFFNTGSGRQILELLRLSLDGSTHRKDPYEAAYAAGRRSVYLDIVNAIGAGVDALEHAQPAKRALQTKAQMPASLEEL